MERRKRQRRLQFRQSELEHWDQLLHLCGLSITAILIAWARLRARWRR